MVQVTSGSGVAAVSPPIEKLYPLMCGQRWLFKVLQSSPAIARPVQRIYRLREPLDTASLLAAFREVVSTHPALCMRLIETTDGPRQFFTEFEAEISGVVVEGQTPADRAAYAWHIFANDCAQPLDLSFAPPFIARIVRVDGEHYFGLCLDHIAADDIATDIFERDLGEAYLRELQNLPHPPRSATQSFFDCLAREMDQGVSESKNLQYWLNHLIGHPLDHNQAEEYKWVRGEAHQWRIIGDAFEKLSQVCRKCKTSLSSAILGAYVRLLSELGGKDDLVVNVPVSNRTLASHHNLIANLSMLLHMRFKLAGTTANSTFLTGVRDQLLEAMVHRHYDYNALGELLAANAAERGGNVHWVTGCNYIIERHGQSKPHPLFEQRLDNQPSTVFDIPEGGFALTCRQNSFELRFSAEWDFASWPAHSADLETRFLKILSSLAETVLQAEGTE